jgi:hypothetical protein
MNIKHSYVKGNNKLSYQENDLFTCELLTELVHVILSGGGVPSEKKEVKNIFFPMQITEVIRDGETEDWEFHVRFSSKKFGCGTAVLVGLTTENVSIHTKHLNII